MLFRSAAARAGNVRKYAVYTVPMQDLSGYKSPLDAAHLVAVTGENEIILEDDIRLESGDYLLVTAVSPNNVESDPGPPIRLE